jgi:translation initiation factor 2 subunit 1
MTEAVRFYAKELPKEDDIVLVRLTRVDSMGIWVELLEYACIAGMIPHGQFTTRKTRRIPKNVKVGNIECAVVTQVDEIRGNMDLTRHALSDEDQNRAKARFESFKSFMNQLQYVSSQVNLPFTELVARFSYKLQERYGDKLPLILSGSVNKAEIMEMVDLDEGTVDKILEVTTKQQGAGQEEKIRCEFEAEMRTPGGVVSLKQALVSGYSIALDDEKLLITVIAVPLYSIVYTTRDVSAGIQLVTTVVETIERTLKGLGGLFKMKAAPSALSRDQAAEQEKRLAELSKGDEHVDMDEFEAL